jgi:hypothetical protein
VNIAQGATSLVGLVDICAGTGQTSAPRPRLHVSCAGVPACEECHDRLRFLRTRAVEPVSPAIFQPVGRPPQVVGCTFSSSSRTPDPGRRLRRGGAPAAVATFSFLHVATRRASQSWAPLWRMFFASTPAPAPHVPGGRAVVLLLRRWVIPLRVALVRRPGRVPRTSLWTCWHP